MEPGVMLYIDSRGWKYRVMPGLGGEQYKARYQKPGKSGDTGWHGVASLPWRSDRDAAEVDLYEYALEHGMQVIKLEPPDYTPSRS